ncbi:MAG: Winged helix DNA-binding domain [Thermoleophilia bacterium]|nr:Winged helix DNA-binding domain [Thermoleophilia bacterium]
MSGPRSTRSQDAVRTIRLLAGWRVRYALTAHQAEVLLLVHAAGATTAATLSREIGITTASMARLVAQLERSGWLVRVPDVGDARKVLLQPSKQLATAVAEFDEGADDGVAPVVELSVRPAGSTADVVGPNS